MSDDAYTGFTVSFKPGGTGYDSPMLVVRGNTEAELLERLGVDPSDPDGTCELGVAIGSYHDKLRRQFSDTAGAPPGGSPAPAAAATPIWNSAPAAATGLTPNGDGTYPACPHGSRPRKPWTSPKNGRVYLFCALDKGTPGACPTVTL